MNRLDAILEELSGWFLGLIVTLLLCFAYLPLGLVVGIPVVGLLLRRLGIVIYHCTPKGKKSLAAKRERERSEAENKRKKREQEENMKMLQFCRALWSLDYDMVIVDTNVFMNTVKESGKASDAYLLATRFFAAIEECKIKVHILTSQLNELAKMNDDETKKRKAYGAKIKIEALQEKGLLDILDDVNTSQSYADREIIKVVRVLKKNGHKPFVITDDRDLRIRIGAEHVLRKSLSELYEAGLDNAIHFRGVHCGRKYVCMDKEHGGVLVANRDRAECWETFSLFIDGKGNYTIQSKENGKFVCAEAAQDGRLVARDATSGDRDAFEFELVPIAGKRATVALKSKATGKFVSVRENQGNALLANGPKISDWEILEIG